MPIVILDGKAFGLIIISGVMPFYVKGISILGHSIDSTPFCPCLDENLSPITGFLSNLNLIATRSVFLLSHEFIIIPYT
jgi:hypothetical protein